MTKNDYYFKFSDAISELCTEKDVRKKRSEYVKFFQELWEEREKNKVSPIVFAEEAIASLGLKRKSTR